MGGRVLAPVRRLKEEGVLPISQSGVSTFPVWVSQRMSTDSSQVTKTRQPAVLIADDDGAARAVAGEALKQDGYLVTEASNGDQAYRSFVRNRPDVVLLDIEMRVRDGYDVCRSIRSTAGGATLPILMITGSEGVEAIENAYQGGATDFIQKPVNPTILRQRVRYMTRAHRVAEQLRESEGQNLALLNAIPDLIFQLDATGKFIDFKSGGATQPILPPQQFLGKSFSDVLPPDIASLCQHFVQRTLSTSRMQVFEYRLDVEGETRDFEARTVVCGRDRVLGIVRDISDRRQADTQLQFHAYHDSLTKLPNRVMFTHQLETAVAEAGRLQESLAVVFVGLDRFTRVNETFGHSLGDLVLKRVSEQLTAVVDAENQILESRNRNSRALVSRFGSDEFTILIPALASPDAVNRIVEQILAVIARPFELSGQEVFLTASAGASLYPTDGRDDDTLLRHAETALRIAKRQGRSSHLFYQPVMSVGSSDRLSLEAELRRGLERHEFDAFFQPQIDAHTGRIRGAEALVRWRHPTRGIVLPGEFLPIAEEMGLMVRMGDDLLHAICRRCKSWYERTGRMVPVAINVSDQEFRQVDLLDRVRRAAVEHGLESSLLQLEITERVLILDEQEAQRRLVAFRDLGIRVALDDFGTGYSSLSVLKGLPIDTLKIDRSFICDLFADAQNEEITRTIIRMGHSLGMSVVAEGVETDEQLDALRAMGCDEIQGFLFSPAIEGEAFEALLLAEEGPHPDSVHALALASRL